MSIVSTRAARLSTLLAVGTVALLAPFTISSAAQATSSQCSSSLGAVFCVWTDSPFGGRFAYFANGSSNLANPIGGYVFDNRITDVWNRTGNVWCLSDGAGFTGAKKRIVNNQQGYTYDFNDRTSSLRIRVSTSEC